METLVADLADARDPRRPGRSRRVRRLRGAHRRTDQPRRPGLRCRVRRHPAHLAHAVLHGLAVGNLDRPAGPQDPRRLQLPAPALEPHLRLRAGVRAGDWRDVDVASRSAEFNHPMVCVAVDQGSAGCRWTARCSPCIRRGWSASVRSNPAATRRRPAAPRRSTLPRSPCGWSKPAGLRRTWRSPPRSARCPTLPRPTCWRPAGPPRTRCGCTVTR